MKAKIRAAIGFVALGILASQAGAVQLRYTFKQGEEHAYKATMKGRGQTASPAMPQAMRMEIAMEVVSAQKVLSVGASGTAEVEQQLKSGTMTMKIGDQPQTMAMPAERVVMTMDARGRVLQVKAPDAQSQSLLDPSMQGTDWAQLAAAMAFPDKDLKPNDVWESDSAVKMGQGTVRVHSRSRLLKLVTYKGRSCAQIRTAFQMPLDSVMPASAQGGAAAPNVQGKVTGEITWYFDHANGLVVDEDGTVSMVIKMSFTAGEHTAEASSTMVMNLKSVLQN